MQHTYLCTYICIVKEDFIRLACTVGGWIVSLIVTSYVLREPENLVTTQNKWDHWCSPVPRLKDLSWRVMESMLKG